MSSQSSTSPFDRSRVQELKWEAMLDAASELFNEKGHTGTSLAELSTRLNVSKRTIYNYVKTKDDLVFHCYARTVGCSLDILTTVAGSDDNGLDKIRTIIRTQLSSTQPSFAVVTEINSLSPQRAARIRADARQCRVVLQQIIRDGIIDRSIIPCNEVLTAMAIFSIISWVPMWFSRSGTLSLEDVADTFMDVLAHGLRPRNESRLLDSSVDDNASLPLAREKLNVSEMKKDALLKAATTLFNRDGIAGTSIDDVVHSIGVTKGAVYYHFENKEELLAGCYERSLDISDRIIDYIEKSTDDALSRVCLYFRYLTDTHAGETGPMMIFVGLDALSDTRRKEIVARGRQQERKTERWIKQGIAEGDIRNIDALLARFMIIGAMDNLPKWYRSEGVHSPREIADCYFDLISEGLQPRNNSL